MFAALVVEIDDLHLDAPIGEEALRGARAFALRVTEDLDHRRAAWRGSVTASSRSAADEPVEAAL